MKKCARILVGASAVVLTLGAAFLAWQKLVDDGEAELSTESEEGDETDGER